MILKILKNIKLARSKKGIDGVGGGDKNKIDNKGKISDNEMVDDKVTKKKTIKNIKI